MIHDHPDLFGEPAKPVRQRRRDEAYEALGDIDGGWRQLTPSAAGRVRKALKDIRTVHPGVSAKDIQDRARNYSVVFPGATITSTALAVHWARLAIAGEQPNIMRATGPSANPTGLLKSMRQVIANGQPASS